MVGKGLLLPLLTTSHVELHIRFAGMAEFGIGQVSAIMHYVLESSRPRGSTTACVVHRSYRSIKTRSAVSATSADLTEHPSLRATSSTLLQ